MGEADSDVVDRAEELAALVDFLGAPEALPGALLFEGEAGIGKTTLWRHGVELAAAASYRVVSCSPSESEARLSFAAIGDLLEPVIADVAAALPKPQRRALAAALLLEDAEGPPADPRAVALAFLGAIRALSYDGPLAVAIDDVQWLDEPSAFVLEFMLRRLRDEPVAILCGLRSGGARLPIALDHAIPENRLQRVVVGPLSVGAVHRLLSDRLDLILSRPKLRRLHELSGGNAFFALELGRAVERGELRLEADEPLPLPLAALVQERVAALPAEARVALQAAAAFSKPTPALVGFAIGGDPVAGLAPALDTHVIELSDGRIRFTHPLLASAVYATMDGDERSALHRRLAEIVVDLDEQARHLALGTQSPDREVAAVLERAAERAHVRGAMTAATELSEQAQRLTPLNQMEDRYRRTIQAASYAFEAGESGRTRALLEEVLATAPTGPWRAQALGWLARVHEYEGDRRVAVELYGRALAEAGDDLALRSVLEDGIAAALFLMREDLPAAAEHARAAVDFADRIGDASAKMMALGNQGLIDAVLGREEGRTALERGVELERALEPGSGVVGPRLAAAPSMLIATALTWSDEFESARSTLTSARDRAYDRAEESSLPWILVNLGLIEFLAGRWEEAERYARDGNEIAAQTGQEPQRLSTLAVLSLVNACRGNVQAARADADIVLGRAEVYGAMLARIIGSTAIGLLELSLDHPDAAHRLLGPLGEQLEEGGVREPGSAAFIPDEIEALIGLGRLDEAEALLDRLERRARRLDRASALAAAGRCRGLLAAAKGDLNERAHRAGTGIGGVRARADPVRASPHPPRARLDVEAGETQARGSRVASRGARHLRGTRRASLGRQGAGGACPDRRAGTGDRGANRHRASRREPRRGGPFEQRDRGRYLRYREDRRGEPLTHLRQARRPLPCRAGASLRLGGAREQGRKL